MISETGFQYRPAFRSLLLVFVACGIGLSQQAPPSAPLVNQERAKRLSDLPLDGDHFKFAFRITDDGGSMVVTAMDTADSDAEEHLQRRLGQLGRLAVHCNFTAPEFRLAGSSQQVRTLCESKPRIHTLRGHDSAPGHTPQNGTIVLEFKTDDRNCIRLLQDFVRAIAGQYPDSELDDGPSDRERG